MLRLSVLDSIVYNAVMLKEQICQEPTWNVAKLFPPQGCWTLDDYLELDAQKDNKLIEFSNGFVEVLPMPSLIHQWIVGFLYRTLFNYIAERRLGVVYVSPVKVRLWSGKVREPDILFVSNANKEKRTAQWFEQIDLAMEIVSPDDPTRDLETKRREYAQAGIPEYWIVDPRSEEMMVLTLDGERYVEHGVFGSGKVATSVLLDGFNVVVAEAFAD